MSIVRVDGRLRVPIRTDLQEQIIARLAEGVRRVFVDISGLTHIDAAGIGELVRAFHTVRRTGGMLQIAHANARVRHLLQRSGLWTVLSAGIPFALARRGRSAGL